MSVFSIIRRAQQAKEQPSSKTTDKQLGKQKEEQATPRYVHVPTHAAADALMGAPAGWMRDDAERIRENNMKRNATTVAAQPRRLPRSGSSAMLSPLHVNMHAGGSSSSSGGGGGGGSSRCGNASTTTLNKRGSQWPRSPSSPSLKRSSSTPVTPATFCPPNFSSLDEELFRARISPLEASQSASYASQSTAAASISPALSSTASFPGSSPSSSPSTSPSTCSTPSFRPHRKSKSKDDNQDYYSDGIYGEHCLSSTESFEMRVLPSSMASSKSIRSCNSSSSIRIAPSQHDIPSAGIQERRRQRNPYAQPVRIEEPTALRLPNPPGFSRSSTERTLVPPTIRSPRPSPTSTALSLSSTLDHSGSQSAAPRRSPAYTPMDGFETQAVSGAAGQADLPGRSKPQWPLLARSQPVAVAF